MSATSEKTILVIDCEPETCQFLATSIQKAGYVVEIATNGVEALDKISENPPDLITLDIFMPRRSGIRILRELHKNDAWVRIPVITISRPKQFNLGDDEYKAFNEVACKHRPQCMLEKPVLPEKLVGVIQDLFSQENI